MKPRRRRPGALTPFDCGSLLHSRAMKNRLRRPTGVQAFLDRVPVPEVPARAWVPINLWTPSQDQARRGVVIGYTIRHYTFYRAVVDRLRSGELFRMETGSGAYEMTAAQFTHACPNIVRSQSYSIGRDSIPGSCFYSNTGMPPASIRPFRVDD